TTLAPGTTAPEVSVTVPTKVVDEATWHSRGRVSAAHRPTTLRRIMLFIWRPPTWDWCKCTNLSETACPFCMLRSEGCCGDEPILGQLEMIVKQSALTTKCVREERDATGLYACGLIGSDGEKAI